MSKTLRFFGVVIGVCLSSSLVMTAFASPQSVNLTFGFPDAVTVHEVEEPDFSDPDFLWGYEEGKQYFLSSLEKNVDLRVGMFGTTGDGCTWVPDSWGSANFRPACDRHDFCYSRQSSQDRLTCDKANQGKAGAVEVGRVGSLQVRRALRAHSALMGEREPALPPRNASDPENPNIRKLAPPPRKEAAPASSMSTDEWISREPFRASPRFQ